MQKPTREQIIKFCHENTVMDFLEIEIINDGDEIHLELLPDTRHANLYSMTHGGVLTTMADTAMGAKCLELGKRVVTVSLTINFMHPIMTGTRIKTEACVLHNGHKTMVCECRLVDANGRLCAKADATFFVIGLFGEENS